MDKRTIEKRKAMYLLFLAVLTQAFIFTDNLAMWISNLISSELVIQGVLGFGLSYVFWISGIFTVRKLYKNNEAIHFNHTEKPTANHLLLGFLLLVACFTISYISWSGFKVVKELMSCIRSVGTGLGIAYFIAQYVYYFLEVMLFFNIIKYAQQAGEVYFKNKSFPYGSIALAIFWGLGHILFHGLIDGLVTTVSAMLMGVAYLALRKNPRYAFVLIFFMFIL